MARSYGIGRRLEAGVVLAAAGALRRLPVGARLAFGRRLGALFHRADRGHRELARRNIAASLGVAPDEAARIARATFLYFGRAVAEVLSLPAYLGERLEHVVEIDGLEHLVRAHARGKGVIVGSAHIGNWEFAGLRQCRAGIPMDYIVRPLDNPWLEETLAAWRRAGGVGLHEKHGAMRSALKTLREGRTLAFMFDQNMHTTPRFFIPFFGRPAATTAAMGHLAVRLGAAVVPAWTVPLPRGRYVLHYGPEIEVPDAGDTDERARAITTEAVRRLEDWIRACPESWLWLHDRWKSQPGPGEVVA